MSNLQPEILTKEELVVILRDMALAVEIGDSYEGNIEYLIPEDEEHVHDFAVRGVFRIGNSMGQGGVRMIGSVPPSA